MISFDVEALHTNMPIEDALVIIKELLKNDKLFSDMGASITKERN